MATSRITRLTSRARSLIVRHGFKRLAELAAVYAGRAGPYRRKMASTRPGSSHQAERPPASLSAREVVCADLELGQWTSAAEVAQVQWERLQKLLVHAYENVPFYRRRMDEAALRPGDIRGMDDFRRLPALTKADVRDHLDGLLARTFTREALTCDATGGSTGTPVRFFRDPMAGLWAEEACARFRRWIGYEYGDKLALMWGAVRDIPAEHPPHERWLNSFNCSPESIEAFVRELVEWRPRAVRAYASAAALVARHIRERELPAPRPRAVESSAEKSWPADRALIEEVFNCPVFDLYGSREVPALACECDRHDGLHIFADIHLVEVIRDGRPARPGEEGAILVTDLTNYGMPFIRYEIGDVGVAADGSCACGRGFPRLREVIGRITNILTTPDGRYVHGALFGRFISDQPGVRAFQLHQKALDHVVVAIQPDRGFDTRRVEAAVGRLRWHLGPGVRVEWQEVESIPPAPSGKRHVAISDVPLRFTRPAESAGPATRKPRVLFIVDAPNWAHHLKTGNLEKHLAKDYDIVARFQAHVAEADLDRADLICVYYWLQFGSMPHLDWRQPSSVTGTSCSSVSARMSSWRAPTTRPVWPSSTASPGPCSSIAVCWRESSGRC